MNPAPTVGQRWSWNYKAGELISQTVAEIVDSDNNNFIVMIVSIIVSNITNEKIGMTYAVSKFGKNRFEDITEFNYLVGQDKPK